MRYPPSWVMNGIHRNVSKRVPFYEQQLEWQLELLKSDRLVEIEARERTEKLKKVKQDGWIL